MNLLCLSLSRCDDTVRVFKVPDTLDKLGNGKNYTTVESILQAEVEGVVEFPHVEDTCELEEEK